MEHTRTGVVCTASANVYSAAECKMLTSVYTRSLAGYLCNREWVNKQITTTLDGLLQDARNRSRTDASQHVTVCQPVHKIVQMQAAVIYTETINGRETQAVFNVHTLSAYISQYCITM